MTTTAIIVAAGQSRRMGFDKMLAPLAGIPVILHTLHAFQEAPCIDQIILVTSDDRLQELDRLNPTAHFTKLFRILPGGRQRYHSVRAGLDSLPHTCHFVAVHDGARPLTTTDDIQRCVDLAQQHGAAACAHRITDTVKRADANRQVTGSVDRTNLWAMETPQVFERTLLLRAYDYINQSNLPVTDEVSAIEAIGEHIMLAESLSPNLKITYPQDIILAEQLLQTAKRSSTSPALLLPDAYPTSGAL